MANGASAEMAYEIQDDADDDMAPPTTLKPRPQKVRRSPSIQSVSPPVREAKARARRGNRTFMARGWSTVKGKGYIKMNEPVTLARDIPEIAQPSKNSTKFVGKSKTGRSKQLSLTTMMKPQPKPLNPKKASTVIHLNNDRGFGIQSYVRPKPGNRPRADDARRKTSLLRLFTEVGLKPKKKATLASAQPKGKQASSASTSPTKKNIKKEIVGDGEEVEVEDGEDLSENELNVIYKRYVGSLLEAHFVFIVVQRTAK
ncbi:DNA helicase [Salix suchowensis]|nr:DNA helicase [Salix suchowensis]